MGNNSTILGYQPMPTTKYLVLLRTKYSYVQIYPASFNALLDATESMNSFNKETPVILPIWKIDMDFLALMQHIFFNFTQTGIF